MLPARKIIIDTDPGVDDAIAILMALADPSLDVLGLTTVGGNVSLAQGTRNALALLEYAGEPARHASRWSRERPVPVGANSVIPTTFTGGPG